MIQAQKYAPRVSAGNPIRATQHNALIAALDERLSLLFDGGKSWLCYRTEGAPEINTLVGVPPLGAVFLFAPVKKILTGVTLPDYDHAHYNTGAAAAAIIGIDEVRQAIDVTWPTWDSGTDHLGLSLEAFTRDTTVGTPPEPFTGWLRRAQGTDPPDRPWPPAVERFHKYGVADLIYEGGEDTIVWQTEWNKHGCLRFHNLNPFDMFINLPGYSFTLPKWSVRAVRRTTRDATTWLHDFKYLFAVVSGDPCVYSYAPDHGPITATGTEIRADGYRSEAACNCQNFAIYESILHGDRLEVSGHFVFARQAIDPDNPASWPAALAPGPKFSELVTSPMADLLYHKGDLHHLETVPGTGVTTPEIIPYNGGADLLGGGWSSFGLTATVIGPDVQITETTPDANLHDLSPLGTNLVGNSPVTLPLLLTDAFPVVDTLFYKTALDVRADVITESWNDFEWDGTDWVDQGTTSDITYTHLMPEVQSITPANPNQWLTPIQQFVSFNPFGDPDYIATNQNTPLLNRVSRTLHRRNDAVLLTYQAQVAANVSSTPVFPAFPTADAGFLFSFSAALTVPDDDKWQQWQEEFAWFNSSAWPLYSSPNAVRRYSDAITNSDLIVDHALVEGTYGLPNGAPWKYATVENAEASPYAFHWPFSAQIATQSLDVWQNVDCLWRLWKNLETEGWYFDNRDDLLDNVVTPDPDNAVQLRVPVDHLQFNQAAEWIDRVHYIRVYTYADVCWYGFKPNAGGLYGSAIVPRGQYAEVGPPADLRHIRAAALGLTIHDQTELPYWTELTTTVRKEFNVFAGTDPDPYEPPEIVDATPGTPITAEGETYYPERVWQPDTKRQLFGPGASGAISYYWVDLETIETKAASLGFALCLQRVGIPKRLSVEHPLSFSLVAMTTVDDNPFEPITAGTKGPRTSEAVWLQDASVADDEPWQYLEILAPLGFVENRNEFQGLISQPIAQLEPLYLSVGGDSWREGFSPTAPIVDHRFYVLRYHKEFERIFHPRYGPNLAGDSFTREAVRQLWIDSVATSPSNSTEPTDPLIFEARFYTLRSPQPWGIPDDENIGDTDMAEWSLASDRNQVMLPRIVAQAAPTADWKPVTTGLLDHFDITAGDPGDGVPMENRGPWQILAVWAAGSWLQKTTT